MAATSRYNIPIFSLIGLTMRRRLDWNAIAAFGIGKPRGGWIMRDLIGRTAIVTGGGHGVGRGIALALSAAGANVVICGRTIETISVVRQEIETRGGAALDVVCDITKSTDLERLVLAAIDRFGGINILVNNAALVPHGTLLEIEEATVQAAWQAGPVATLNLMRLCHPHLKGGGVIVNVSSGVALQANAPIRGIYAAVKAALNAISRAAANEWGADGIRVNTIMPLARSSALDSFFGNEPERAEAMLASIPLGRVGDPEADIGAAVTFLVGPAASFITGVTVPVDGGVTYLR
jgi:meso-butanediol dehydrogenase/(S,S)-butanediol dehydrogenase/diacetyl reductase